MTKSTGIPAKLIHPGNVMRLKRVKVGRKTSSGITHVVSAQSSTVAGPRNAKAPLREVVAAFPEAVLGRKLSAQAEGRLPVQIVHCTTGSGSAIFKELQTQLGYVSSQFAAEIDEQDRDAFMLDSRSNNHHLYDAGKNALRELRHLATLFQNDGFEDKLEDVRTREKAVESALWKLRRNVLKVRVNADMGGGNGDSLWHFSAAEQGSRMYMGVRHHCNCDLRNEVADGFRSVHDMLNRVSLSPGDWWRLRAGHPYGATLGVEAFGVMADPQEITVVEDRCRGLVLDNKAVLGPGKLAKQKVGPRGTIRNGVRTFGMRAGDIRVDHVDIIDATAEPIPIAASESVALFTPLSGAVTLSAAEAQPMSFKPGEAALLLPGASVMLNATKTIPSSAMIVRPLVANP